MKFGEIPLITSLVMMLAGFVLHTYTRFPKSVKWYSRHLQMSKSIKRRKEKISIIPVLLSYAEKVQIHSLRSRTFLY